MAGLLIAASAFAFVALLLNITAVATVHWLDAAKSLGMNIGIFHHCDTGNGYCGAMDGINAIADAHYVVWFRVIQATFMVACLGSLLICVIDLLVVFRFFDKGSFKVSTIACLFTFSFEFVTILLFGLYYRDIFVLDAEPETALGFSYYMAIVGTGFVFACLVTHILGQFRTTSVFQNIEHRLTTAWNTPYTLFIDQEQ